KDLERFFRCLIDASDALRLACLCIDDDVTRHCVRSEREAPGLRGCRERRARTAEVRRGRASAIAMPAVVTSRAPVVPLSQNRRAADGHLAVFPPAFDSSFEQPLAAGHLHRGE